MKKSTKVWLLTAAGLVVAGCLLFVGVMSTLSWDFRKLSTLSYETHTYEIREDFHSIALNTDVADIQLAVCETGPCRVECHEAENASHRVSVENGVLTVEAPETWTSFFFSINFDSPKIRVYLPKTQYDSLSIQSDVGNVEIPQGLSFQDVVISLSTGNVAFGGSAAGTVQIQTETGDIRTENVSAGGLHLSTSTGDMEVFHLRCQGDVQVDTEVGDTRLWDVTCKTLTSFGSLGDVSLEAVVAEETFFIERSTGSVRFSGSDAPEISVKTEIGDITGTLLTEKIFMPESSIGDIDVPKTTSGGPCQITTDMGDIRLDIA